MKYMISLLLTILIEGIVALRWRIRGRDLLLVVLVNVLTNPLVVLWHSYVPGILLGTLLPEAWAMGTEALIYRMKDNAIERPVQFALWANGISFFVGIVLVCLR